MYASKNAFIIYTIEELYIDILIFLLSPRTKEEQDPLVDMNKSLTNKMGKGDHLEQVVVAKSHPDR